MICIVRLSCTQELNGVKRTFKGVNGVTCKNGEEWLIKMADTEAHIPDVYEEACLVSVCLRMCAFVCL